MKILIKTPFLKYKAGDIIEVATSQSGIPCDRFFRNRIKDSQVDNCVEVIVERPLTQSQNKKSKQQESTGNADIIT